MDIALFFVGLLFLLLGAEILVRGASSLAASFGLSPLVVGLTVVAFGTSSPELAVSVAGSWNGSGAMAIGNVVGSNVFNVLFILGVSALIVPLAVERQIIALEAPILVGASLLAALLMADGAVGRLDGILLAVLLVGYVVFTVVRSRREARERPAETDLPDAKPWRDVAFIVVGLALLVVGSDWLVEAAVSFARFVGLSETVIALTIISAGTSLPEVATSVTAALRGQRDIAVGNVVGSCVFNLLGVLGLSAAVAPAALVLSGPMLSFDIPVMVGVALVTFPIVFTGRRIDRWEGGILLALYVFYVTSLILRATGTAYLATFEAALTWFVAPMVVITLIAIGIRERGVEAKT